MTTKRAIVGAVLAAVLTWAAPATAQEVETPPAVEAAAAEAPPEAEPVKGKPSALRQAQIQAHKLAVENAQLRAALGTLRAELDSARLSADRAALEAALRAEIKPPDDAVFDWNAGAFVKAPRRRPGGS